MRDRRRRRNRRRKMRMWWGRAGMDGEGTKIRRRRTVKTLMDNTRDSKSSIWIEFQKMCIILRLALILLGRFLQQTSLC